MSRVQEIKCDTAVLGAGPGGYPAAFHAADLGQNTVLIDPEPAPGGVCLYRGCIPSKAFLHAAKIVHQARAATKIGITFSEPQIDVDKLHQWKKQVVKKLTGGLAALTKQRGITYLQGTGKLTSAHEICVTAEDGSQTLVQFENAILASGSEPVHLSSLPADPRIMDSTGALELEDIPETLLVVGGGYIGLELGQVYAALGSRVSVVEMTDRLLPGVDKDLVQVLEHEISAQFAEIMLKTKLEAVNGSGQRLQVRLNRDGENADAEFDRILVAVGRRPVTTELGLEKTKVTLDDNGFVKVDAQRRTAEPHIFAIGDITGQPLLAHKATHEGRTAAEIINGKAAMYKPKAVPAVVFTDPEIAWCGLTEAEAERAGMKIEIGSFPWQASGRAATLDRPRGLTKIIADADDGRVLGVGIAGHGAAELIGEAVLAIEMGAVAEDLALTIHAHPSLSETIMEAAEDLLGHSTHFFNRR